MHLFADTENIRRPLRIVITPVPVLPYQPHRPFPFEW